MSKITPLTNQKVFNNAYIGVLKQGGPATNGAGSCRYREGRERKCGIGHSIPDALYTPEMEGSSAGLLLYHGTGGIIPEEKLTRLRKLFSGVDEAFAFLVQEAHDHAVGSSGFEASFRRRMEDAADRFNLTIPKMPG